MEIELAKEVSVYCSINVLLKKWYPDSTILEDLFCLFILNTCRIIVLLLVGVNQFAFLNDFIGTLSW